MRRRLRMKRDSARPHSLPRFRGLIRQWHLAGILARSHRAAQREPTPEPPPRQSWAAARSMARHVSATEANGAFVLLEPVDHWSRAIAFALLALPFSGCRDGNAGT